ncbi:MAG: NUDIX domain-containing protein [Opitutales bacterium]
MSTRFEPAASGLPFRISTLIFLRNAAGELLLLERRKAPNLGCWSPIGGKLEMAQGESPFECAAREVGEEAGLAVTLADLHLFGMISEKGYEGSGHWLLFLFDCRKPLPTLPPAFDEGHLAFFERPAVDGLRIPETDRQLIWPLYDERRDAFTVLRADCNPANNLNITVEERH